MIYKILRCAIALFMNLIYRPTIEGKENIPLQGSVILAGNHTDYLDWFLVVSSTKRTVHFLGKHTLFKWPLKSLMRAMHVIPVDRTKAKNDQSLTASERVLKNGEALGIFPEGTINRTSNEILPFKMGAVYLSKKTNSPIVPFVITGKYRCFKRGLKLTFLEPIEVIDEHLQNENESFMAKIKRKLEGKIE